VVASAADKRLTARKRRALITKHTTDKKADLSNHLSCSPWNFTTCVDKHLFGGSLELRLKRTR
jgi:hypothetical protein